MSFGIMGVLQAEVTVRRGLNYSNSIRVLEDDDTGEI